jgi:hypothetical protein
MLRKELMKLQILETLVQSILPSAYANRYLLMSAIINKQSV